MSLRGHWLSVLNRVPPQAVKDFVETLLPLFNQPIEVLENRTGLVMLPATDPVQGQRFHLAEVLVSQAYVRLGVTEGYTVVLGRDLEQSLAIALLDAALAQGLLEPQIQAFVQEHAALHSAQDQELLRQVEATRVRMETF